MGGRGSNSNFIQTPPMKLPKPPQQQPQPPQQQAPQVDPNGFSDTDNSPFHNLVNGRGYFLQQNLDVDAQYALSDWLDPKTTGGTLYNFAQNTNEAIRTGRKLTGQEQYAWDSVVGAMHNLGQNLNLTRYDHGEFIDRLLGQSHAGMTVAQLKSELVGASYTDKRILSTSYNNFKNMNPTQAASFITREVKISYRAKASTQALMPGRGPGGDFGEVLLAPSGGAHNSYRIVDVKLSGSKARPKGGSTGYLPLQQLEVVVEVD